MALLKCSECGGEVSDKADKCPKCGAPLYKPTFGKRGGWLVLFLLFFVLPVVIIVGSPTPPTNVPHTPPNPQSTLPPPVLATPASKPQSAPLTPAEVKKIQEDKDKASAAMKSARTARAKNALAYLGDRSALPDVEWVDINDWRVSIGFKSMPRDAKNIMGAAAARGSSAVEGSYSAKAFKGGSNKGAGKEICDAYAEYRPNLLGRIKAATTNNSCW